MTDTESLIFDQPSRGDMEQDDVGSCPGWYPYVGSIVDMHDNSRSLGGQAAAETMMAMAARRADS
jgi:hypothetical protein